MLYHFPIDATIELLVLKGWKIVGDNLDLTIKVRDMRLDNPNQSYHFFHSIAVQDRIVTSHLDDTKPQCLVSTLSASDFMPSSLDYQQLRNDFIVLVARILVAEFPEFHFFYGAVPNHIQHMYSTELSKKSTVVSAIGICTLLCKQFNECGLSLDH